jgi:serine protease AprX
LVKSGAYSMPASALAALAADPDVAYIAPDRPVSGALDKAVAAVGGDIARNLGYDGTGIGVAIIDSGVDGPDVNGRIVYSQSWIPSDAKDHYGHGTHVAGIIAGSGGLSKGLYRGLAPQVKIVNLRVLDDKSAGKDSDVIAAIQRAIALQKTYNIRVINLSLGRPVYESYQLDPLCQAVEQAWKAGIVVVVAAGNEGRNNSVNTTGYGTITAPGNDPFAITVGAMKTMGTPNRADDQIASYSSKGPTLYDHVVKPDLLAPGNRIISVKLNMNSLMESQYPQNEVTDDYFILSGTSMAAPMVSGAAALLLQKSPGLTPDQVKARLMKTAYKILPAYSTATDPTTGTSYTSQYDVFTVGAGYLDVQAALSNTDLAPATAGSALSPTVTKDASGNTVLVNGSSVIWGHSVMWGNSVVWGTSVLWGTNVSGQSVLWGSSVCWGSSATQGYSVLWGTGVVWGTSGTPTGEAVNININGEN